jgi:hypothetical protein
MTIPVVTFGLFLYGPKCRRSPVRKCIALHRRAAANTGRSFSGSESPHIRNKVPSPVAPSVEEQAVPAVRAPSPDPVVEFELLPDRLFEVLDRVVGPVDGAHRAPQEVGVLVPERCDSCCRGRT